MLSAFSNSLKIPELRQRILFTLGLVFICRLLANVPTPGIEARAVMQFVESMERTAKGGFVTFFDLFSGGALRKCAVGTLGIMPYISAAIILQLMTAVIPSLERLAREGEAGRQRIAQITRYLTLGICVLQSLGLAAALQSPGFWGGQTVVLNPGWRFSLMTVLCMTTGTMLVMWLGEQITDRGIGNGASLIIMVNIVSQLPSSLYVLGSMFGSGGGQAQFSYFYLLWMAGMFFLVTAGTIALTQGVRRVPVHTTKRVVGRKVYGGQNTYMPLRVNYAGVMPIIFASVLLQFPAALFRKVPWGPLRRLGESLAMGEDAHVLLYAALIFFFSFFWVATQFNPLQIADDLKRNGGYVPGIRPGRPTGEFLDKTMTRVTAFGAMGLTIIAVIPSVMLGQFGVPYMVASFFGGTSLLIVVGVLLDTMRQVEAFLLMRHYDGFLSKGKLRGRR